MHRMKMDHLQEGHQYALSTKGECNNSLIFVKLTDSAMQSIEMYLSSQTDSSFKPTIQFQENSGTISLLINGRKQNYKFALSNIEADGSFQCLQHTHNKSLQSLGIMLKRMHIHANEDSYEKTKFKMEAVDKEQKSLCTKEIKSSGTLLGRKFKVKRPGLVLPPDKFHLAVKKSEMPKFNMKNKLISSILQQPVRKRIIHILAVKPYKKPELLLRLKKEGIIDKDKKDFNTVLTSVGIPKGNIYHLAGHLWNEVQENWEFFTKEELQVVQRRKQQFLKTSSENEVPCSVTPDNSAFYKSNSSVPVAEKEPLTKKRRISHNSLRITDQGLKDNFSECDNFNSSKLPAVINSQKIPDKHLQVNGNCSSSHLRNKNPVFGKEYLSSKELTNSDDQINGDNHISDPCHSEKSSRKQSTSHSNFQTNVSKLTNSKGAEQNATICNSHFNGTFNLPLANSDSHSKVLSKGLVSSQCEEKDFRRYKSSNTKRHVHNKTSHSNSISVIDSSNVISPVSYSSDSSLSNKDKCNGFHKENPSIIESVPEFEESETMQTYKEIETKEQRSCCAKYFNVHYEEYLKLHAQVKDVSLKYAHLNNCLDKCESGSTEYKKIKAKILELSNIMHSSDYLHTWNKYNLFKSKLSHIKRLIKEYDNFQEAQS